MLHRRDAIEILSSFLFNSPKQKEHLYSAFNSVMPDNIQFIYGKLIKIHQAGPACVCFNLLKSTNHLLRFNVFKPLGSSLPSSHATYLTLVLTHANKQLRFSEQFSRCPSDSEASSTHAVSNIPSW